MPITNKINLNQFLEIYSNDKDRVVFFIGAGLAYPLFPLWQTVLLEMVDLCSSLKKLTYKKSDLVKRIKMGQGYIDIAEACVNALGKTAYRDFLEKKFGKNPDLDSIPDTFKELFALQPQTIVTTNYDLIPEVVSQGKYKIYDNTTTSEAMRSFEKRDKIVFKLHGNINNQNSIILTNEEYQRIIHNNEKVKNFIRTLFSGKTVVFLGFSLTDIHIDLILTYLHSINDGLPIIHYALMSTSDQFAIDSFERNYGMKIIPYKSSDGSHTEVLDFIKLLSKSKSPKVEPLKKTFTLNTANEIGEHLNKTLRNVIGSESFAINYEKKQECLYVSYTTRSATELELQREILALSKSFNFETPIIRQVVICVQERTPPSRNYEKFNQIILGGAFMLNIANDYSNGIISGSEFWSNINFFLPKNVGSPIKTMTQISISYIGGEL